MVNINISITRKHLFVVIGVVILLAGTFVYAYGTPNAAGDGWESGAKPATMGHSADEVHVFVDGAKKKLQNAIDQGLLGGGGTANCQWYVSPDDCSGSCSFNELVNKGATGLCRVTQGASEIYYGFLTGYRTVLFCQYYDSTTTNRKRDNFEFYACK